MICRKPLSVKDFENFLRRLLNDPTSYLNQQTYDKSRWNSSQGVKLSNGGEIRGIGDFLRFAGVML